MRSPVRNRPHGDHHADTVIKKEVLWSAPACRACGWWIRATTLEILHNTEFGLCPTGILAGSEILSEKLVPEFQFVIAELFATPKTGPGSGLICLNAKVC